MHTYTDHNYIRQELKSTTRLKYQISPDIDEARWFLNLLDSVPDRFTFQTFDDDHHRKCPKLCRLYHGSLNQWEHQLWHKSFYGAGVFVCIHETDLLGRKTQNTQYMRCFFADLDGQPLEVLQKLELEPHIIIESSPSRYHAYWLIKKSPYDHERWRGVQGGIASLIGSDPSVNLATQLGRLPGFIHQKRSPFVSRIIHVGEHKRFTPDEPRFPFITPEVYQEVKPIVFTPSKDRDFDSYQERARHTRIEDIARRYGIWFDGTKGRPCPVCAGTDRFYITVDRQMFQCRNCFPSHGKGPIKFAQFLLQLPDCRGQNYLKILEFITGLPPPKPEFNNYDKLRLRMAAARNESWF